MIWLAWRQFRLQACVAVGLLVAVAIAFALTGPHIVHVYDTVVRTCASRGDCPAGTACCRVWFARGGGDCVRIDGSAHCARVRHGGSHLRVARRLPVGDAELPGRDHLLRDLSLAVILVPALVGMFWGAPLIAREMETGSFRLAWTQSVTRS